MIPRSSQHRKAHAKKAQASLSAFQPSNKADLVSFVEGIASTTPIKCRYYHKDIFNSEQQQTFYIAVEATRRIKQATLVYQGRTVDTKRAKLPEGIQDIYDAGVKSRGGKLNKELRKAIHEACSRPRYERELFEAAWKLWEKSGSQRLPMAHRSQPSRAIRDNPVTDIIREPIPSGGPYFPDVKIPPGLHSAMRVTQLKRVNPGETIVKELIHHSLLDIETGMVMRERQILRAGMVVTSLAARLYRGRTDIFQRHIESYTGPLMAFIMDMSGSMASTWPGALAVMGAVAHTLNRAGASTICIGFAADDSHNLLYQFQDMDEAFDIDRFNIFSPPSGNADAVAVEYCRRRLLSMEQASREPKKKYIVVFSDESPCGMVYQGRSRSQLGNDTRTLNEALNLCKTSNVMTISSLSRGECQLDELLYDARMYLSGPETTLNRMMERMGVL